jgi:twitching motility two-component system response regulator PilH
MRPGSPFQRASLHADSDPTDVLLVQNDPFNRQFCATVLSKAGFTVRGVADGATAWEHVATWSPDIVVTDLELPHMDGVELCRRLRDEPRTRDVQIFGVSKSTSPADYVRALKTGFNLLLHQPCDPGILLREISHVRVHAAGLRRRARLALERASAARSDAANALACSRSMRERYDHRLSIADSVARIRSAYYELPGLKLTIEQGARLWSLDPDDCSAALFELVHRQFLVCRDGCFYLRRE